MADHGFPEPAGARRVKEFRRDSRPAGKVVHVARHADDFGHDPAVIVANPDVEVTPELFFAWLDRVQQGEPVDPGVRAADTLAEIREHGED